VFQCKSLLLRVPLLRLIRFFYAKLYNEIIDRNGRTFAKKNLCKWSIWLILAMLILFVIGLSLPNTLYESVPPGGTTLRDIIDRQALAITMLVGFGAGIAAFISGLISIIEHKELALLVFVSTLIGTTLTLFLSAEIFFLIENM